ncbi:hypothetical protein D9V32_11935 [Mycetocola tolaasinivorans]|uniref:Uncharacterized protein n=2 Tax=Mycetocola tolaasinivorans TaxID=76635 RepID=A0A3L7A335_9MICO|nr:hypothetical protein D9V32_11935 [Mycetocola tolaasinivorans]
MGSESVLDAAGVTQAEAEALTPEQRFDVFGERYVAMHELLAEAQREISEGEWKWLVKGAAAYGGLESPISLHGATSTNSYTVTATSSIRLPGAVGERSDLDPMLAFYDSHGWEYQVTELRGKRHWAKANTGTGFWLDYMVQPNGYYSISIFSEAFWGDSSELLAAVVDRLPESVIEIGPSVPGVYIPFPKWSDPVIEPDFYYRTTKPTPPPKPTPRGEEPAE